MELQTLKELHDKAYSSNQVTREQAADDLVFYWVTQWDDQLLSDSQLQYRGQFDIVRKAGRQIMSDLRLNPVQPDFKPKDESREDAAEVMDGLYRADDRRLDSQEAYDGGSQDAVVCGFGAWELYTTYENNLVGDLNQVIRRRYIPEANNNCFFDSNAVRLDKSDANFVSILYKYSEDGYKDLYEELTGEETDETCESFAYPEESYTFPWVAESKKIYVASIYHRKKVKDKIIMLQDPMGQPLVVREADINDVMDELVSGGYNVVGEKEIDRWQIKRYICTSRKILKEEEVAGQNIPVIPVYGERATSVEGEEYYEGFVRLAKDAQRLRNFHLSYLADIVSQSPRPKPMFNPEQIEGFEDMYDESGSDNNYPYYLINRTTADGDELPNGAVSVMPEQQVPTALLQMTELTRQAVEDVANAGNPQDIADPDLSGKAVLALQARMDNQSYIYQHNFKHAKRRDAEVYASMASEVYDAPRKVTVETDDGQTKEVQLMQVVIDAETGEPVVLNDITNMEFDVYADIGQTYQTQKQQTRQELVDLSQSLDPDDPLRKVVMMKALELMDGVQLDDVRDYVRKQLLIQGFKEPETEEDMQAVMQAAQQQQQPDAATILALAEQTKAEAAMIKEQREAFKDQADVRNDEANTQIDAYEAETNRQKVEVDAARYGAEIDLKRSEQFMKRVDNAADRQLKDRKEFLDLRASVS